MSSRPTVVTQPRGKGDFSGLGLVDGLAAGRAVFVVRTRGDDAPAVALAGGPDWLDPAPAFAKAPAFA